MYICNFFHWVNWTAVSSVVASLMAIRSLPGVDRWLKRPKVKLRLVGPTSSGGFQYWHIEILNTGSTAKELTLCIVASKDCNSADIESRPRVRLLWPYEKASANIRATRDIQTKDLCDFFSTENSGNFHVELIPKWLGQNMRALPMEVKVGAFAEGYESSEIIIKVQRLDSLWQIQQI